MTINWQEIGDGYDDLGLDTMSNYQSLNTMQHLLICLSKKDSDTQRKILNKIEDAFFEHFDIVFGKIDS